MKLRKWRYIFTAFLLAFGIFFGVLSHPIPKKIIVQESKIPEFPRLSISLNNVSLETIDNGDKDIKYSGNTATFLVDGEEYYYEDIEIKGRGNSTWNSDKKPYQIKFKDKINLFGLGKAKNWILLANAYDPTHLRNEMAYYFADLLEEEYVIRGEFVELYIDDSYRGLYYLTHKVEISTGSVNLKDEKGVLVEVDTLHSETNNGIPSSAGQSLILKDFVSSDERRQAEAQIEFMTAFNALERYVIEKNWNKIVDLIDVESFAGYYLISDFTDNVDAYITSHFFYKNGSNDKIHAGPAWDFDLAFGNADWKNPISPIFESLVEIPEFQEEVKKLFREKLYGRLEEYLTHLDKKVEEVRKVALKNNERWGIEDNFDVAVAFLREWIAGRFEYLEEKYEKES